MNKEWCLQGKTGSCKGCEVFQSATQKSKMSPENTQIISNNLQKSYVPKEI